MHHFRYKQFAKVSFDTSEGKQLSHFQNGYFFKILWWCHQPQNQVKCWSRNLKKKLNFLLIKILNIQILFHFRSVYNRRQYYKIYILCVLLNILHCVFYLTLYVNCEYGKRRRKSVPAFLACFIYSWSKAELLQLNHTQFSSLGTFISKKVGNRKKLGPLLLYQF